MPFRLTLDFISELTCSVFPKGSKVSRSETLIQRLWPSANRFSVVWVIFIEAPKLDCKQAAFGLHFSSLSAMKTLCGHLREAVWSDYRFPLHRQSLSSPLDISSLLISDSQYRNSIKLKHWHDRPYIWAVAETQWILKGLKSQNLWTLFVPWARAEPDWNPVGSTDVSVELLY